MNNVDDGQLLPESWRRQIATEHSHIDLIHFDEAWFETGTREWIIPTEMHVAGKGWHHGNMSVQLGDGGVEVCVDWSPGMHPDLHTFER